jgi:hypothetical protein
LAWGDARQNHLDRVERGQYLSEEDVECVRACKDAGLTAQQTAEGMGCSAAHVRAIWRGATRS